MGQSLSALLLDVIEKESELEVGLHVPGVLSQCLLVLRDRALRVAGLEELVSRADEGVVVEELLANPPDGG